MNKIIGKRGRKPKSEPIDIEKAKKLKALRESVFTDTSFIKERCKLKNETGCKYRNGVISCEGCSIFEAPSLTPLVLIRILNENPDTESRLIYDIEKGEKTFTPEMEGKYKKFFGEDLYNKYVLGKVADKSDIFVRKGTPKPYDFLFRDSELTALRSKVKSNTVTVVCADGGVGKTSLVKKFLYDYNHEFEYYQTLKVKGEDANSFNLQKFLNELELSSNGKKEFFNDVSRLEEKVEFDKKIEWTSEKLRDLHEGLFVLDNYTCVGNEISKLEEEYPNCKFIITTRQTQSINEDNILRLKSFNEEEACKLFELYLGRKTKPLTDSEKDIFLNQINSWCLGNAEAIYYVAKMLDYNITPVEDYSKVEKWTQYYSSLEKDLTGNSSLADKLALLMKMDKDFIASIKDCSNKQGKLLAILSITETFDVPLNSVIDFLEEGVHFKQSIIELESKGFIKIDKYSHTLKMHPLICHALLLNGIDVQYTTDMALFAYLITNQDSIAFKYGLTSMSDIITPKGITKIGVAAFSSITYNLRKGEFNQDTEKFVNLKSIVISEGVTEVGDYAFASSHKLTKVSLPYTLKKLGEGAFWFCKCLTNIQIPKGIKDIPTAVFGGCKSLRTVKIPDGVQKIGEASFWNCHDLLMVEMPEGVVEIEKSAFYRCKNLVVVKTPNSLTRIGEDAFSCCHEITKIVIPNIKHIGEKAFRLCDSLTDITIPDSLTSIGKDAFDEYLKKVHYLGDLEKWYRFNLEIGFDASTKVIIEGY